MSAKLAISFITYNRAKHINEDLSKIALPTQKKGIDIYIFDGSTNNETELVVKKYREKGYEHIFYFHYEDNLESTQKRMEDALFLPDAEYIWFSGDKFVVSPNNYDVILKYVDQSFDMITIYGKPIKKTRCFHNPVKYVEYSIIPFTQFGATIIKKELIEGKDIKSLREEFPGFWKMMLYIRAIDKADFKGVTIAVSPKGIINSRYKTKSNSWSYMWDTWVKDWYYTISSMPARYNIIKEKIMNRPDKDLGFFSIKQLFRQRSEGQFDFKKCIEYRKYFSKVILVPDILVYFISLVPKKIAKEIFNVISMYTK